MFMISERRRRSQKESRPSERSRDWPPRKKRTMMIKKTKKTPNLERKNPRNQRRR